SALFSFLQHYDQRAHADADVRQRRRYSSLVGIFGFRNYTMVSERTDQSWVGFQRNGRAGSSVHGKHGVDARDRGGSIARIAELFEDDSEVLREVGMEAGGDAA